MSDPAGREAPTSADEVASYLRRHPEFLHEYADLALTLLPPREEGRATSLASYQLEVLRDKNRELGRRLAELVNIANENEHLVHRVHGLTVSLLRETTLAGSLRRVVAALREDFHDQSSARVPPREPGRSWPDASVFVRLVLFCVDAKLPAADWLILEPGGMAALPGFAEWFGSGEPLCGRLQPEKLAAIYGDAAREVHSSVLLPLADGGAPLGMLAVGSTDPNRFHPGMGTLFLTLIAQAVSASIARFATS